MSILNVQNLRVEFATKRGVVEVIRDVSFQLEKGQSLGIVGESGSGKSVTSLSLLRLLPETARILSGKIEFQGQDILQMSASHLEKLRGSKIAMIFQDPISSLNPCYTVQDQIAEALKIHENLTGRGARDRVLELLNLVGIPDPQARLRNFPHELSGGMSQRVMIAMAMACRPELLIADEPTTALDVTIQSQILSLLQKLRKEQGMSLILVSHDLGVIAQNTDQICVMYAGEVVENGSSDQILRDPQHPYTKALLRSLPALQKATSEDFRLPQIPGQVLSLSHRVPGCQFQDRCEQVQENCRESSISLRHQKGRDVRCLWT